MDVIEEGFSAIVEKIKDLNEKEGKLSKDVAENQAALLAGMAGKVLPFIPKIGMEMLIRGKQDGRGEMYDTVFHDEKMIILGKVDPMEYRPDDMNKKVTSQYCVLSEEGKFYELMYSTTDFIIDSYKQELTPEEVLDLYGYDIMFMLYRALREYLQDETELVNALEMTLSFVFENKK